MAAVISGAMRDIAEGWSQRAVWLELAKEDVTDQHRRTRLGPVWLVINYLAFACIFIVFFGERSPISNFAAYVSIGLLVWFYLAEVITHGMITFKREASFISGTRLPLSVYAFRLSAQSLIRFIYAALGCLGILILSSTPLTVSWLWAIPGLLIVIAITPAIALCAAILGTLFPDLEFVVSHLMRLGIFLTPVFWSPSQDHTARSMLYLWDPFTYFLEVVRAPITLGVFPLHQLLICMAIAAITWAAAILLLGLFRKKIVFLL